jgi:hypothetical protein
LKKFKRLDVDRVIATLKQIVRDWTSDGLNERIASYLPIINDLKELYPKDKWLSLICN